MRKIIYTYFVAGLSGLLFALPGYAYQLRGKLTDDKQQPIPYASIYVQNTTYGVASNLKGEYFLELDNGQYEIVFQAIGFERKIVSISIENANRELNVQLKPKDVQLEEVQIVADKKDPAYEIIAKAIKAKKKFKHQFDGYSCTTYIKASLEKEYMKKIKPEDSTRVDSTKRYKNRKDSIRQNRVPKDSIKKVLTKEKMNFIESYGKTHFRHPNSFKEIKFAYKDLSEKQKSNVEISFATDDGDVYHSDFVNKNLFKLNIAEATFNFYKNAVNIASLGPTPYISPISVTALLSYRYRLVETFLEDSLWINKIEVTPIWKEAALFRGHIYIVEDIWSIKAVDLEINPAALYHFKYFRILGEYSTVQDSIWVVSREEFFYNSKDGKAQILGNTLINYKDYELNPEFPRNFFKNELRITNDDAYEKDTAFWAGVRPITLKDEEIEFIHVQDSIDTYHKSEKYLKEKDSTYNHLDIWDFLLNGVGFTNSFKKQTIYFDGLISQLNPLGIGGYRHSLGGEYSKEWSRANKIKTDYMIDYGFNNSDIRGEVDVSYVYQPKKLGRVHVRYGNTYDMINNYESIQATFSRSNYINVIDYAVGHEMEVLNGLFLDLETEYSEKRSIENMQLSEWSEWLFGDLNEPVPFEEYNEFLVNIKLRYTFAQQYYSEPYKKVILGSKYPKLTLRYRKGIPRLFDSDVDFDFMELQVKDDMKMGTMGLSKWKLYTGKFLRGNDIRFTDFKFFRGSDPWFYSNPLWSFQLLGPSISTRNEYLQLSYLHHFNGTLLNKIPLVNKLGLQAVAGAGTLLIKDNNFRHGEAFVGLEWPFRIRGQLMKIGAYYVGADSNHSELDATFKFGFDFFNSFTNSWSY